MIAVKQNLYLFLAADRFEMFSLHLIEGIMIHDVVKYNSITSVTASVEHATVHVHDSSLKEHTIPCKNIEDALNITHFLIERINNEN